MTFAVELAQVLDDGDNLRVVPIVTHGAADLLYLRQVDVAVTQSNVFKYFRTQRKISNLEYRVNYIMQDDDSDTSGPPEIVVQQTAKLSDHATIASLQSTAAGVEVPPLAEISA